MKSIRALAASLFVLCFTTLLFLSTSAHAVLRDPP
jgi:hypothetical protein